MTTPDLVSLVLTVRPAEAVTTPGHLGRAAHALLLRWLDEHDPALARHWHDTDGPKPFTCSTLIGGQRIDDNARALVPGQSYWLRFTALDPAVARALLARCADPPDTIELDHVRLPVESATVDPAAHPWAGTATFEDLARPYLLRREQSPRRVELRFASPVTFRQNGLSVPLPLPDLVFGGLADRWNAFSPIAIAPEVRRYAASCVALSGFRLISRGLPHKDGGLQIGAVGRARYVAVQYDRYWMATLGLLADFALYAGVGRLTTTGLGQARRVAR